MAGNKIHHQDAKQQCPDEPRTRQKGLSFRHRNLAKNTCADSAILIQSPYIIAHIKISLSCRMRKVFVRGGSFSGRFGVMVARKIPTQQSTQVLPNAEACEAT